MAKILGAWPRPWRLGHGRRGVANTVGCAQGLGGVAKSVRAKPNPNLTLTLRPWGCSQGRGGVAKDMEALPRPWGRGQVREG